MDCADEETWNLKLVKPAMKGTLIIVPAYIGRRQLLVGNSEFKGELHCEERCPKKDA